MTPSRTLVAGDDYLQVDNAGGKSPSLPAGATDLGKATKFDMASYFLSGSVVGAVVPEPGVALGVASFALLVIWRRRAA